MTLRLELLAMTALDEAIANAGSQKALADAVGVTRAAVSLWKMSGRIPAERVVAVEKATGVLRSRLRPDIFGDAA